MSAILVTGGVIYVGFSTLTFLVIFVLLKIEDHQPEQDAGHSPSAWAFTEDEIARLVSYRNAVRAGYFREEIEPRAVSAGHSSERHPR